MNPLNYLITAKNAETRAKKVLFLFYYFKEVGVKHAYNQMIQYIAYTDEQIENEIENQIEFHHLNILESVAKGSLDANDALKQLEGAVPTKIDGQAQ
jgi:hypothetical protein